MTKLTKLLIIDPQNDFCDIPADPSSRYQPAMPVPGANADMLRLAKFIERAGAAIDDIIVTMDSHPYIAIERTTFWLTKEGVEVAPFTEISAADVTSGRYLVRNGDRIDPISQKPLTERVIELLLQLEAAGHYKLMVWPVHCVTGTWGANIHSAVADALAQWELNARWPVRKVQKGEYPLAEHYGVFEAETPLLEVDSTRFNTNLAREMSLSVDTLFVAGEASSHCVAASVEQLIKYQRHAQNIVLLTDCMSPVPGFEKHAADFFQGAAILGAKLMSAEHALTLLNN